MSEEWTEWKLHDGRGCPCEGQYVQTEDGEGALREHIANGLYEGGGAGIVISMWDWEACRKFHRWDQRVVRYRIRKPRGMEILEKILEEELV